MSYTVQNVFLYTPGQLDVYLGDLGYDINKYPRIGEKRMLTIINLKQNGTLEEDYFTTHSKLEECVVKSNTWEEFLGYIFDRIITLTFGDAAENHVGMQQLGQKSEKGFSYEDLMGFKRYFESKRKVVEMIDFKIDPKYDNAWLMIVRNGFDKHVQLFQDMIKLDWDKKALMKGRVVNKHARWNLCWDNYDQEPDYEAGKGRVIDVNKSGLLKELNDEIHRLENIGQLKIEGNYYYDVTSTYIGFHGDKERRKVCGVRLGASMPIYFRWYHKFEPVSSIGEYMLNSGDIYFMSEKAVGTDWKSSSKYTLRHAASSKEKLVEIEKEVEKKIEKRNK